jgi:hypothetical protein
VEGCYDDGNELSGCTKIRNILYKMSDYQLMNGSWLSWNMSINYTEWDDVKLIN